MKKSKPATASKQTRKPKIAAKAQRATQAVVRSPKDRRPVPKTGPAQAPPELDDDTLQEDTLQSIARLVENPTREQQAGVVESPATAVPTCLEKTISDVAPKKEVVSYSGNVGAYQAKL